MSVWAWVAVSLRWLGAEASAAQPAARWNMSPTKISAQRKPSDLELPNQRIYAQQKNLFPL